jgi:RNA ligase (TIGR02306 family)
MLQYNTKTFIAPAMKLASIEEILEITPHPNADSLEFAKVLGYRCLVPKDRYQVGELVILIQPDTVLPEVEWSETYRKFSKKRVKAIRLRGEWSFGIVESLSLLPTELPEDVAIAVGQEVSELLDITKYEPPPPKQLHAKGGLPHGIIKTDEERYQNLQLEAFFGKRVDVTLKVDGQSFTAYYKDGEFGVCGRTLNYQLDCKNDYTDQIVRYDLENKLRKFCEDKQVNLALRGESYGQGIQSFKLNPHAQKPKGLVFFSVWLIDEMRYAVPGEPFYFPYVCQALDLPVVPFLETHVEITPELIQKYDEGLEQIDGEGFEGVVMIGEDFSFKVINKHYDSCRK